MTLSDIGKIQPKAWKLLTRAFASERVASTYLFLGHEGLGHWQLALSFAALLNCRTADKSNPAPCGECPHCRQVAGLGFAGMHFIVPISSHRTMNEAIDLTNEILEAKRKDPFSIWSSPTQTSIPIDLARGIRNRLALKMEPGMRRVVLFYQMDKMLFSSADALLKMIEEPPLDTTLILTAISPDMLPSTIQSRSQKIRLNRVPEEFIQDYLVTRYPRKASSAKLMAHLSEGNLGIALRMIESARDDDGENDGDDSELSHRAVGLLLFKTMMLDASPTAVSHIVELLSKNDRTQGEELLRLWHSLVRDCAHYAITGEPDSIVNSDFKGELMTIAPRFQNAETTSAVTTEIKNTLADIRLNVHIPTAVVALALRIREVFQASR